MLLEVLDDHGDVVLRQRFRGAATACSIGRSRPSVCGGSA